MKFSQKENFKIFSNALIVSFENPVQPNNYHVMLSHGKSTTTVICALCAETIRRYNNSPPYVTVKMATLAIALHGGEKET